MARKLKCIPFDEFANNLGSIFDRVVAGNETVVVETSEGARAVVKPFPSKKARGRGRVITDADYEAFLSSAGSWKGVVDTDKLVADIYESRRLSSRPPVEL